MLLCCECYLVRWCANRGPALQESSVQELRIGRHNLKNELSERTGQLKALVRQQLLRSGFTHAAADTQQSCTARWYECSDICCVRS